MRHIFAKTAVAGLLVLGMTSCANDLNISSIDPQTSTSYEDMELLAKVYGTLGMTGQKGPAGSGDISSDEGESGFYRTTFNLQTLPTDECNWAWQTDTDIPQITGISWNANSTRTQWAYQRLGFNVLLCNFYLQNTADKAEEADYKYYRAEVRFLRALFYWYFLDLWHKAPFKDENNSMSELPVEKVGADLYNWLDTELTAIESEIAPIGQFNTASDFGRADAGAVYLLHARLALNAKVYTDGAVTANDKAISYCDKVINGPYALSSTAKTNPSNGLTYSGYAQLFMADNDANSDAMNIWYALLVLLVCLTLAQRTAGVVTMLDPTSLRSSSPMMIFLCHQTAIQEMALKQKSLHWMQKMVQTPKEYLLQQATTALCFMQAVAVAFANYALTS